MVVHIQIIFLQFVLLFIHRLFNDVISFYIASTGRMISEQSIGKDVEAVTA
jgi:hypothetical protein